MRNSAIPLTALAMVSLLIALSLVTWRQTRSLEALAELDRVERDISLLRAEKEGLERTIQSLESRGHVVPTARDRLNMRTPTAGEIILLPGDPR